MAMNFQLLIDPATAAFVLGGVMTGTAVRSGWANCRETLHQLAELRRRPFDAVRPVPKWRARSAECSVTE